VQLIALTDNNTVMLGKPCRAEGNRLQLAAAKPRQGHSSTCWRNELAMVVSSTLFSVSVSHGADLPCPPRGPCT
jgi:hypothetical protein